MANPFITSLREEIGTLEKGLEGDPRFKKLKRLMAALEVYLDDEDDGDGDDDEVVLTEPSSSASGPREHGKGRMQSEKNEQILDFATTIIREGGNTPIRTRDILATLQERGVAVHGKTPRNTLSAILSYSERFTAHGKSGWTIKGEDEADQNTEAADDPNLAGRTSTASADHRQTNGGTQRGPVNPWPGGGT